MEHMKIKFLLLSLILATSCTSVVTRSKMTSETRYKEDFIFYTGTRVNYEVLTNKSEKKLLLRYLFGIPDMPLSIIADTIFIPLDFIIYANEKAKQSDPGNDIKEIKLRAESIIVSLNNKDFKVFRETFMDTVEVQTSLFDIDLKSIDEERSQALLTVLKSFVNQKFLEPSYERGGRLFFKGGNFLVSFRKTEGLWYLSTASAGYEE